MKRYLKIILYGLCLLGILIVLMYLFDILSLESSDPLQNAPQGTLFTKIDNDVIAYSEIDNHASTTIIFIGGLGAWHGTWQRTIDVLSSNHNYNYIAIDLPPFGYSVLDNKSNFFRDTQAQRIAKFVASKQTQESYVTQVILVGHSYGAGPTTEMVLHDTRHIVSKLIIIDGVLNIDEYKAPSGGGLMQVDTARNFFVALAIHSKWVVKNRLESFVHITTHIDGTLVDTFMKPLNTKEKSLRMSSWLRDYTNDPLHYMSTDSKSYGTLKIPVRIIWGEKDSLTPLPLSTILVGSIPDSKLYVLKDVGHIPMIEDYTLFDEALQKALHE